MAKEKEIKPSEVRNTEDHPLATSCRELLPLCYENWPHELKDVAMEPLASIKIPLPAIKRALEGNGQLDVPQALDEFMENEEGRPLFFKLSSRCPKDFLSNNPMNLAKPEPVSTAGDIIEALMNSERTIDDLVGYCMAGIEPMIHIYPFVHLPLHSEFRVFVKDRMPRAMTQYYYPSPMPDGEAEKANIRTEAVRKFINKISAHFPTEDIVVDIIMHEAEGKFGVKMLELNPYYLSDPCLFESYEKLDKLPLGAFSYRYNRAEMKDHTSYCMVWKSGEK